MDVVFPDGGGIEFIITSGSITQRFRIAEPMKYGLDKWRHIRNRGISTTRYDGCKMASSTPSNITMVFYEGGSGNGTYQVVRLIDGMLELSIELEKGDKKHYAMSCWQIPIEDARVAIDKLLERFEKD